MEVTFKYNGTIISTPNLEKKLKRMRIIKEDIEIITLPEKQKESDEPDTSIKKYYFKNSKGETIVSIYDNLKHLEDIIPDINDYEQYYK